MPRIKYLGKGNRLLAVSGFGVIHLAPGQELEVEERVAYRMLEANIASRKPLYEFLDVFPPVAPPPVEVKTDPLPEELPAGLMPYKFRIAKEKVMGKGKPKKKSASAQLVTGQADVFPSNR
jgi:hypothetical protein